MKTNKTPYGRYLFLLQLAFFVASIQAQSLVLDVANLAQAVTTGTSTAATAASAANIDATTAAAYAKQVQQYSTQLQQYTTEASQLQNMIQNTKSLTTFSMPNSSTSITGLQGATTAFNSVSQGVGGVNGYVGQVKTSAQYFSAGGLITNNPLFTQGRMAANADSLTQVQQQNQAAQAEGNTIEQINQSLQGATGNVQALQATGQELAEVNNQLLQERQQLSQMQQAQALRDQEAADKEAVSDAISKQLMQ